MVTFDEVLPTLVRVAEEHPIFKLLEQICVVRDPEGRVRIAVKAPIMALAPLEQSLSAALQNWFVPPILLSSMPHEQGKLANALLQKSAPWPQAAYTPTGTLDLQPATSDRWRKIERRLSKLDWLLQSQAGPPWPLSKDAPAIVTFFSFKGGVGRTTLLASCAWQLSAIHRKRVVIVDLDMEAPGLGALFEAEGKRGVIDFLVDHIGTDRADLDDLVMPAQVLGAEAANLVDVISAGSLSLDYLEKLSRLDFVGSGLLGSQESSPVHRSLRALLGRLRGLKPAPDYILLDSRAGLHDIAGLSLHGLAHVDVLVGRASEQGYQGLELTVQALGQRKNAQELLCVIVHALAPLDKESSESKATERAFLERSYRSFCDHIYSDLEEAEVPQIEDDTASHWPWVIRRNPLLDHFTALSSVREVLYGEGYRRVLDRIMALCTPSDLPASSVDSTTADVPQGGRT